MALASVVLLADTQHDDTAVNMRTVHAASDFIMLTDGIPRCSRAHNVLPRLITCYFSLNILVEMERGCFQRPDDSLSFRPLATRDREWKNKGFPSFFWNSFSMSKVKGHTRRKMLEEMLFVINHLKERRTGMQVVIVGAPFRLFHGFSRYSFGLVSRRSFTD